MTPSKLLRRFLDSGTRPSSQREASALLDESRSLLVSKLPTTGEIMNTFTAADLDSVNLKGGNVLDQMHAAYLEKQNSTPPKPAKKMNVSTSSASAPRPAVSKPSVIHRATSTAPATATKPAAAPVAPAQLTAAEYATKPLVMKMDEFNKLTPTDRMRFVKDGGKLA